MNDAFSMPMQIWIMRIYFYSGKFCIGNEEKGKTVGSHYFRRDRRALWSRRHWRIIGDVDNEIKVAKKMEARRKLMHRIKWSIELRDFSVTSSSKKSTKMWKQNAHFRGVTRKAFTCCEINFLFEMLVIIVLYYLDAFYQRKIKHSKPQFNNFIRDIKTPRILLQIKNNCTNKYKEYFIIVKSVKKNNK